MRRLAIAFLAALAILALGFPQAQAAAPSIVTMGTVSDANGNGNSSFPATYPAGPVAGDYAVAVGMSMTNAGPIWNTPAGYTLIDQYSATCCSTIGVFIKKLTGSETGTLAMSLNGAAGNNNHGESFIFYVHGMPASGTLFEGVAHTGVAGGSAATGSSITTTGADELVITLYLASLANGDPGSSTPALWTNALANFVSVGSGFDSKQIVDYRAQATAGTVVASARLYSQVVWWTTSTFALLSGPAAGATSRNGLLLGVGN